MRREHRTPAEIEAQIQAQIHAARDQIEATRARVNKRTGRDLAAATGIAILLARLNPDWAFRAPARPQPGAAAGAQVVAA